MKPTTLHIIKISKIIILLGIIKKTYPNKNLLHEDYIVYKSFKKLLKYSQNLTKEEKTDEKIYSDLMITKFRDLKLDNYTSRHSVDNILKDIHTQKPAETIEKKLQTQTKAFSIKISFDDYSGKPKKFYIQR